MGRRVRPCPTASHSPGRGAAKPSPTALSSWGRVRAHPAASPGLCPGPTPLPRPRTGTFPLLPHAARFCSAAASRTRPAPPAVKRSRPATRAVVKTSHLTAALPESDKRAAHRRCLCGRTAHAHTAGRAVWCLRRGAERGTRAGLGGGKRAVPPGLPEGVVCPPGDPTRVCRGPTGLPACLSDCTYGAWC